MDKIEIKLDKEFKLLDLYHDDEWVKAFDIKEVEELIKDLQDKLKQMRRFEIKNKGQVMKDNRVKYGFPIIKTLKR
jgi:hypothetical protein